MREPEGRDGSETGVPSFRRGHLAARVHAALVGGLAGACGIAFAICLVLVALDIALRFFALGTLPWVIEITEYVLYAMAFLGAPWVLQKNAHVQMDALVTISTGAQRKILTAAANLIGALVSAALLVFGLMAVSSAWSDSMVTRKVLSYPEWIILLPIPIGGFLLVIEFALRLLGRRAPDAPGLPASGGI